jgi:hypothetical protein
VKAVVKLQMFSLPNFMRIEGMPDAGLDVGSLFLTDTEATEFWEGCLQKWLDHVAKRRAALSAGVPPNE